MGDVWQITIFTLGVALLGTLLSLPPGIALAWLLARRQWRGKSLVETLVTLPLVLPPVATGLLLLRLLSANGPLGALLEGPLGMPVVFTWRGVVVATGVMAFPLLVRTVRVALEEVDPRVEQVARTLGAGPWDVFFTVTLPLAARGVVGGTVLAWARALGEFGATAVLAGIIPGRTITLALGIYHEVQLGHDERANQLMAASIALAAVAVIASEWLLGRRRRT